MKLSHIQSFILLTATLLFSQVALGQKSITDFTTDSVELQQVVKRVLETHPSVLKAEEAINSVEAGIGLAKSAYYPNIELGASYTRIGPVPAISIPELGSFEMAPANNYNTSLNIYQTVYDFSKTKTNMQVAESGKAIVEKNIDMVKQKLTSLVISNYFTLVYLQEAVHIKEIQLGILEQHLDFITRKKETGSATDYEILSTKVRISVAKNQKYDTETALSNQLASLNSLLGLPVQTRIKVKNRLMLQPLNVECDSLINYAIEHRNELILGDLRKKQAELHLQSVKIENNPVVSAFFSGGIKNGYFPDLNQPKANYAAGLGINVPIFSATRHRNYLQMATSDINSIKLDIEQGRRQISSEVFMNVNNLQNSLQKIDQSELQLDQAEEARRLADLSYKAGSLTNLDLLDSESLEAESRLNLLRVRTEYMINAAKLEISIGKPGY
ncbi:MAG: TolC family protein [Lentimicrobiaceae bacterium]|jgi:outer membrane protein TolC